MFKQGDEKIKNGPSKYVTRMAHQEQEFHASVEGDGRFEVVRRRRILVAEEGAMFVIRVSPSRSAASSNSRGVEGENSRGVEGEDSRGVEGENSRGVEGENSREVEGENSDPTQNYGTEIIFIRDDAIPDIG